MMIGIYKITNTVNGKVYIGQSWDIGMRWNTYCTMKGHNQHLNKSFEKYGFDNFDFDVLVHLQEDAGTQLLLDVYESQFIDQFDSMNPDKGYNKRSGGGSGGRLSAETRAKISAAGKEKFLRPGGDELRARLSAAHTGKKRSAESIAKTTAANTGKKRSDEIREKMSVASKNRSADHRANLRKAKKGKITALAHTICCLETGEIFIGAKAASKSVGVSSNSISSCCTGKTKTSGGYHWEYVK